MYTNLHRLYPVLITEKNKILFLLFMVISLFALVSVAQSKHIQRLSMTAAVAGNTYYVSVNGSDTNSGTETQPFKTLTKGVSVLVPGDTLLVMPGTYSDSLSTNIPSGTSWDASITLKAFDPNNKPVIMPASGSSRVFSFGTINGVGQQYIVVDGFVLDGKNLSYDVVKITYTGSDATKAANHIRIMNSEIRNSPAQGILVTGSGAQYNEFINDYVHNNGNDTQLEHGFYISTANNMIDGSIVANNAAYGIQLYNSSDSTAVHDNIIRNTKVYSNANKAGIVMSSGNANIAYNNSIWGNGAGGIKVDYGATNTKILNNTFYSNSGSAVQIGTAATGTIIENNIFYKNTSDISNSGSGTNSQSNLLSVNPLFVNELNQDFHLQASSSAVDTGMTLAEVTTDADLVTRPQGAAYDKGAYEFVVSVTPSDTSTPSITLSDTPTPSMSDISPTTQPTVSPTIINTPTSIPPTPLPTATPTPIVDTIAPTVTITSPANGATLRRNTTYTIKATATDNVKVTKVEFLVNGVLKCTDTTASYSCSFKTPSSRTSLTLTARGYDAMGNIGTNAIAVTVK